MSQSSNAFLDDWLEMQLASPVEFVDVEPAEQFNIDFWFDNALEDFVTNTDFVELSGNISYCGYSLDAYGYTSISIQQYT
jgi:hypothetical protein